MAAIYTANHLQKNYGSHVALRDVSFSIEPGRRRCRRSPCCR